MAQRTVELEIVKSGYIRELYPTDVFPTDSTSEYEVSKSYPSSSKGYYNCLCFGFAQIPDALKYYELDGISLPLYFDGSAFCRAAVIADFDVQTLTYANRKENTSSTIKRVGWPRSSGWSSAQSNFSTIDSAADISRTAAALLQSRAFMVYCLSSYGDTATYAKAAPPAGTTQKVIVTYDDAKTIRSKVTIVNGIDSDYANATMPITVTWDIVRDDSEVYYCAAGSFEQQSATFYWRAQGETAWNAITPQTASDKSVTIPAATFQSSKSDAYKYYEYYIEATDVNGLTTTTAVTTFRTNYTQMYAMGTFGHYYQLVPAPEYDGDGKSPYIYYWNPHQPITFYWATVGLETYPYSGYVHAVQYASGYTTIAWKIGQDGEENEIQVPTFGVIQYSVPANTFPSVDELYYQIRGTDSTGVTSSPEIWIKFTTAAGKINSVAIAPVNTVESYNQAITFEWAFSSDSVANPSRYELVWREYGAAQWTVLRTSTEPETTFTVPPYTFPVGQIEWAVFAYNVDDIIGDYVSSSFISYGAPEAPLVSATNSPFTQITWQAENQQAFEVDINGVTYGPYFGEDKQFELPDKLSDGQYTIRVRIAGTYFLWSEYGTATINVENSSEYGVYLSGAGAIDAQLTWETDAETGNFYVYRDGVIIARTLSYSFNDKFANGKHEYKVINRFSDGNYAESNAVLVDTSCDGIYISSTDIDSEWIHLKHSIMSGGEIQVSGSSQASFYHYYSNKFPNAFISNYFDSNIVINAAFKFDDTASVEFEKLLGKSVVVKRNNDPVIIGVINAWTKMLPEWPWQGYSITIQRIDWGDYVDGTGRGN